MAHEDKIPKKTEAELRKFVDDFVSGRIFTDKHINRKSSPAVLGMVFLPIAMGALADFSEDEVKSIGCVWEHNSKAGPRSINGMPCFGSANLLHIDDWNSIVDAIVAEEERRKNIVIKKPEETKP